MSSIKSPGVPRGSRKRPVGPLAKQNELLSLACKFMKESNNDSSCKKDEYDDIAKVWAEKLRKLEPRQRMFAEKAINDVLFEATLQLLQKDSVKINDYRNSAQVLTQPRQLYSPAFSNSDSTVSSDIRSPPNINTYDSQSEPRFLIPVQAVSQDSQHNSSISSYFSSYSNMH